MVLGGIAAILSDRVVRVKIPCYVCGAALTAALVVTGTGAWSVASAGRAAPEMVLHGGHVYTVDSAQPWAEAIAIEAGKIVAVGNADEVLSLAVRTTEIVDLAGRMVLPGFHDPHVHVVEAGVNQRLCLFQQSLLLDLLV